MKCIHAPPNYQSYICYSYAEIIINVYVLCLFLYLKQMCVRMKLDIVLATFIVKHCNNAGNLFWTKQLKLKFAHLLHTNTYINIEVFSTFCPFSGLWEIYTRCSHNLEAFWESQWRDSLPTARWEVVNGRVTTATT